MTTTPIHIGGLASGIDTDSIITKLMSLASQPLTLVQNQSDDDAAKKAVISTLNSKLSTLQTTVDQITDVSMPFFSQDTATSTDETKASATVTGSRASTGSFSLVINQLASSAMVNSQATLYTGADSVNLPAVSLSAAGINLAGQSLNASQPLNTQGGYLATGMAASGTISINGTSVSWDDSMSMNQVLGEINNASLGVTASFDSTTQKLSLSSSNAGSTSQITLGETSGNFWEAMNITPGTFNGSDAKVVDPTAALGSGNANLDRAVTSGTFTINGVVFNLDASSDSLNTVLSRINNSNAGVTALYDSSTGQVSLHQNATGASQKIVLGAAGDSSNVLYALKLSSNSQPVGGVQDTYSGTDASVNVNGGVAQTFSKNSVNTLISGVTVDLNSVGTTTLNVGTDVDGMVSTIQTFVSQYNDVMNFINDKLQEQPFDNPTTAAERIQGAFVTDPTFQDIKTSLEQIANSVVSGQPSNLNQLAQIGITTTGTNFGQDATLEVDEDKLRSALSGNLADVKNLFNTSSTGIMSQLDNKVKAMTAPVYGTLASESGYYDSEISNLATQLTSMQDRLDQQQALYQTEFSAMETMVSQLQSQGSQLTQMTSQLSA
jgi:flagellar hook-associated protein 2